MPTFSVVVTNYNYRPFIVEAVDSALAQTRAPAQVIVVDDGSTDGSAELLRERYGNDARVTLVFGENGGQLVAFQRGVAMAAGDVICFLDADDRWSPRHIETVGALFDARRDIDFVFTDLRLFGDEEKTVGYADRAMDLGFTVASSYRLAHWYGAPTSALSMRSAWARRTLDMPASLADMWRICADMCLVHGTSVMGARKYFLPTGTVHYRVHGNNGWYGQRSPQSRFLNHFRARSLVRYYAQRVGVTEWCLADAKYEFLTKPEPSWSETRRYAKLALRHPGTPFKNLENALSILRRGWKMRHGTAVEADVPP